MIFAHTLDKILCGDKQQTRRLVKPHERLVSVSAEPCQLAIVGKRTIYQVGKTYAVQPNRGKKAVARILLTGLRRERVRDISSTDAVAEGFHSCAKFIATWLNIHGQNADLDHEVWVLEFELCAVSSDLLQGSISPIIPNN